MSIGQTSPQHPVLACAAAVRESLAKVAEVEPVFMSTGDKATALTELTAAAGQLAALTLRVLAAADDVAVDTGARSAAAWLAHQTRTEAGAVRAAAELGQAVEHRWHRVRDGLVSGAVNPPRPR